MDRLGVCILAVDTFFCLDTDESPELFKSQIYSQTGVPPERQKIMVKGGILKVRIGVTTQVIRDLQECIGYNRP